KFSPKNSTVQFDLQCQGDAIVFQIRDEGIGIPVADQRHLFEPFERGSNVGTISGTGLGLAIVKKLVDLHGGQIAVSSVVSVGTTVTVTLPLNSQTPSLSSA
ncbi:MAG: sensor histidine kinase, partial [Coleofasciculus sp. S288]|nr:sensor histidine kinase [Coleofasciculus sp. S288]